MVYKIVYTIKGKYPKMNIAERISAKIKKMWSAPPSLAASQLLQLYHTNPRLDGARIIANKCASVELYLYNKGDYRKNKNNAEVIENHEIYNLLENPCPTFRDLTGWNIRYFVFACYTLTGEAYLLKIRSPNGKVIALTPIAPSWVVSSPSAVNHYWEIYPYGTTGGSSIIVPPEDVICFKDIDLNDPYSRGRGTAEAIGDEIQSDEYASKYAKNLFFNDATPSAIIYAPQGNKDTADMIKKSWLQKMAGINHAKEPMVLTGEGSKFESVGVSPRELDFVESRKFLRDSANQHFHIPPEIMGILENSNRSTIDSAFYLLNKNVLADYLRMFERVLNTQLLWEDFDKEKTLILHHENTIEEDVEQKLRIANEGLSRGVLTRNEWRVAMGYEPDEKNGDVYLMGFSTIEQPQNHETVELPEEENAEEENAEIELPKESHAEMSEKDFNKAREEYGKKYKILKSEKDNKRREKIWKVFDVRARSIEKPFIKGFEKAFEFQKNASIKAIKEAVENGKDAGTAIENLYGKAMDEGLKHSLAPAFLEGLEAGAKHGTELLGKKDYKDISDTLRKLFNIWIDNKGLELCKDMNETTKKKLRKALSEAVWEGSSVENKVKALTNAASEMFDNDRQWRAELIARTESCATMNYGATALYQSEGVEMKEWIATRDDRTRDSHALMDGVVIAVYDKFEVPATEQTTGGWLEYPGDPSADPSETCNCRCSIAPFVRL